MMKQDNIIDNIDLLALAEDVLDILCELPEEEVRRMFNRNRTPQNVDFRRQVGGTEYTVVSSYGNEADESLSSKLERLLEGELTA